MIKTTQWTPGTCGCVLHYTWDDTTSNEERVHTPIEQYLDADNNLRQTKRCPMHQEPDLKKLHDKVKIHHLANKKQEE